MRYKNNTTIQNLELQQSARSGTDFDLRYGTLNNITEGYRCWSTRYRNNTHEKDVSLRQWHVSTTTPKGHRCWPARHGNNITIQNLGRRVRAQIPILALDMGRWTISQKDTGVGQRGTETTPRYGREPATMAFGKRKSLKEKKSPSVWPSYRRR